MFSTPDATATAAPAVDGAFCGHCGERLPRYGARLGFCPPCARAYRPVILERGGSVARDSSKVKDPLLATVLSAVIPGGGQVYNAQFIKAGLIFITSPLVLPWLIGIADAYFSARRINERAAYGYGTGLA